MLFPIAIECGDSEHSFGVIVPDLDGCHSAGDTLQMAFANAKEAIKSHLELLSDDGEEIPIAQEIDQHFSKPEFKGFIWGVIKVNIDPYLGKTKKFNITMPMNVNRQIESVMGELNDGSRSGFVTEAVMEKLARLRGN